MRGQPFTPKVAPYGSSAGQPFIPAPQPKTVRRPSSNAHSPSRPPGNLSAYTRAHRSLRTKPPHTNRSLPPSSPIATSPDPPHANLPLHSIPRQRTPSPHPPHPRRHTATPSTTEIDFTSPDPSPAHIPLNPIPRPPIRPLRPSRQLIRHSAIPQAAQLPRPISRRQNTDSAQSPASRDITPPFPPAHTTLHPISRQQKSHCAHSLAWPIDHPANPLLPPRHLGRTTASSPSIPSHRSHRTAPAHRSPPIQRRSDPEQSSTSGELFRRKSTEQEGGADKSTSPRRAQCAHRQNAAADLSLAPRASGQMVMPTARP